MGLKGRTLSVGNRKHKIRAFSPFCGHAFAALPCCCINELVQPAASCSPSQAAAGHPAAQHTAAGAFGPLPQELSSWQCKTLTQEPGAALQASNIQEASLGLDLQRGLLKVSKMENEEELRAQQQPAGSVHICSGLYLCPGAPAPCCGLPLGRGRHAALPRAARSTSRSTSPWQERPPRCPDGWLEPYLAEAAA